jgi:putative ABC transport system permease protein
MAGNVATRRMTRRLVLGSILRRRSRVAIAVLAVGLGATTLFALATLALDLPRHLTRDLRSQAANLVVLPAEGGLTPADLAAVDAALATEEVVSRVATRYVPVTVRDLPYLAAGTDLAAARAAKPYWDVDGAWPTAPGEALIGRDIATATDLGAGDRVTIEAVDGELDVTVTGILSTGADEDTYVVLASADLAALGVTADEADLLELSVARDEAGLAALAAALGETVPGVTATPVTRLAHSEEGVLAMLRTLLALIAGLVVALSLIGVATTMTAVVTERRAEIALRKALGAADRSIAREFLAEGLVLGGAGGLVGVGLGFALAAAVSQSVFGRGVGFTPWLALVTVAAATGVTYVACVVPVRRAAAVDPATYLREE